MAVLSNAIQNNSGIKEALDRVSNAMNMYTRSVTILNAVLTRDASLKKQKDKMLDWLLLGTPWEEKHKVCLGRRVPNIGDWIREEPEFLAWLGNGSNVLLCHGSRTLMLDPGLILY